ncbi:MAG: GAF domain-containing protein [Anaerolineae bacterium]|nr:GAF domain-containing protein [Anaerolineae bacterium]
MSEPENRLLQTLGHIGEAAVRFLKEEGWMPPVIDLLRGLGELNGVSRAYLLVITADDPEQTRWSMAFEWARPGITPHIDHPRFQNTPAYSGGLDSWRAVHQRGEAISGHTRNFPPSEQTLLKELGICSIAAVPVLIQNRLWGVLVCEACEAERDWTPAEVGAVRMAAGVIASAVERQEALQEVNRSRQQLLLLGQISGALSRAMDLPNLIRLVVDSTGRIFGYPLVSLYLLESSTLVLQHSQGYTDVITRMPISKGVLGRVARTGMPAFVKNIAVDPDYVSPIRGLKSEICVPLFERGQVVGVFNVETDQRSLTRADYDLMLTLSDQISVAIERTRLYDALRANKERYQQLVEHASEVIFQCDREGRWTFLNPAWMEITGWTVEQSLGQLISGYMPAETAVENQRLIAEMIASNRTIRRFPIKLRHQEGRLISVELSAQVLRSPDGNPTGLSGTILDISSTVKAATQAAELTVQRRTMETLKGFLSSLSHDLKTPLSVMTTTLYLLRRKLAEQPGELRYLDALDVQIDYLTRATADILDLTRLDDKTAEFQFVRANLSGLVRDVLVSLEATATAKEQKLTYEQPNSPIWVMVDQVMMGKAIRNLVDNALQYTPNGGSITVSVDQRDQQAVFQIADTGIGIDPEDLPHIFDRFYKANKARPTGIGGTGLGLPIVKKVIEAHQGVVQVESIPDEGTTFTIRLPLSMSASVNLDPKAEPPPTPPSSPASS